MKYKFMTKRRIYCINANKESLSLIVKLFIKSK